MQKAGIAGVAAGAIWAAPSVLGSSTAFADGSCVYTGALLWSGLTKDSLEPITNSTVTGIVPITGVSPAPSIRVVITVTPTASRPGAGSGNNGGVRATVPYPPGTPTPVPTGLNGNASYYAVNMNNGAVNRGYDITFAFQNSTGTLSRNVYNLKFTLYDIDRDIRSGDNNYVDAVTITGTPSGTHGVNVSGSGTNTPNSPWTGSAVSPAGGVTDQTGNVAIAYGVSVPINTTTISYRSNNTVNSNQIQYFGIGDLTWCY